MCLYNSIKACWGQQKIGSTIEKSEFLNSRIEMKELFFDVYNKLKSLA